MALSDEIEKAVEKRDFQKILQSEKPAYALEIAINYSGMLCQDLEKPSDCFFHNFLKAQENILGIQKLNLDKSFQTL